MLPLLVILQDLYAGTNVRLSARDTTIFLVVTYNPDWQWQSQASTLLDIDKSRMLFLLGLGHLQISIESAHP